MVGKLRPLIALRSRHLLADIESLQRPRCQSRPEPTVVYHHIPQKNIYHNTTHSSSEYFRKEGTLQDVILTCVLDAPNVGTLTDPVRHRQLRNRLLPGFTMKGVLAQEPVMRLHVDRMIERIEKDPGLLDLSQHLVRFAWDMIGDLAFGEPLVPEKCGKVYLRLQAVTWVHLTN